MKKPLLFLYVVLFFVFFIRGFLFLDPDFGWHIRNGELMLTQGLIRTDPYSYTMPQFSVVSHEWLTDVVWFVLYSKFGLWAITFVWAFLPLMFLFLLTKGFKKKNLLITVLAAGVIFPFYGNRPQVLGWIFFALVLQNNLNRILPIIFLLWANLHGSFAAGLALLGIVLIARFFTRKLTKYDLLISGLCVLATLINPFGLDTWREIWSSVMDQQLRWRIGEWGPAIFSFQPLFLFFVVFVVIFVLRYRKKFTLESLAVFGFFLVQAIGSLRHIPLFVAASMPILLQGFSFLEKEISHPEGKKRLKNALHWLFIFITVLTVGFSVFVLQETISEDYYPSQAIAYIREHRVQKNIFSHYNWGGYLIWKLPEKKVFIDGRMPSWREGEVPSAMDEYLAIINGEHHFKTAFAKYEVDTVLWPKSAANTTFSSWVNSLSQTFFDFTSVPYNFLIDLERNKWKKIYEDDTAVIYTSP